MYLSKNILQVTRRRHIRHVRRDSFMLLRLMHLEICLKIPLHYKHVCTRMMYVGKYPRKISYNFPFNVSWVQSTLFMTMVFVA